jgi:hypothetical protein
MAKHMNWSGLERRTTGKRSGVSDDAMTKLERTTEAAVDS